MTHLTVEQVEALVRDAKSRIRTSSKMYHNSDENWGCEMATGTLTYWEWIDEGIDALGAALQSLRVAGGEAVASIVTVKFPGGLREYATLPGWHLSPDEELLSEVPLYLRPADDALAERLEAEANDSMSAHRPIMLEAAAALRRK